MIKLGITRNTGGNVSVFIPNKKIMLITPSNTPYDLMKVDQIIEMDLDGDIFTRYKNVSSEWRMHAEVYKIRKDVKTVIHAHAVNCMTVSTLGKPLPAIDYLVAFGGSYQVPITKYARYGTKEIAKESGKYLKNHYAVLLANHGINVCSENLYRSFAILENLELCAEMYWKAKTIGDPQIINKKEMLEIVDSFKNYGLKG